MVTDALFSVVATIIQQVNSLLPSMTVPAWLTHATVADSLGRVSTFGHMAGAFNDFLPVTELVDYFPAFFVLLIARLGFTVFMFLWLHLPTIAGFGTK